MSGLAPLFQRHRLTANSEIIGGQNNENCTHTRKNQEIFRRPPAKYRRDPRTHINSTMRHGTTSQQLGNVLSKDKDIVKVGYIKRSGILSGGYDICEWATRIWVQDHCPGWSEGTPIIIDQQGNITMGDSLTKK